MTDEERIARFRVAALRWKAAHWRPQTPAEKGVGWSAKVNAMTRGDDPRQSAAWWAKQARWRVVERPASEQATPPRR